jgi:hypothetical protein
MEQELEGKTIPTPLSKTVKKILAQLALIDIYCISAVGFYKTLAKSNAQPFVTSLYKIN